LKVYFSRGNYQLSKVTLDNEKTAIRDFAELDLRLKLEEWTIS